jgi:hypothetical protein
MYTSLGVLTKGTVIEVNVSELGMVTAGGKVVFGKYAQVTNNPENDGCINAVLRASLVLSPSRQADTHAQLSDLACCPVRCSVVSCPSVLYTLHCYSWYVGMYPHVRIVQT